MNHLKRIKSILLHQKPCYPHSPLSLKHPNRPNQLNNNKTFYAPNPIRVSPLLLTSKPRSAFLVPLLFPPGPLSNSLRNLASLALSVPRCCVSSRKAKVMRCELKHEIRHSQGSKFIPIPVRLTLWANHSLT